MSEAVSRIVLGTRGSRLALAQCRIAADAILKANPGITLAVRVIQARGDQSPDEPLSSLGGKGVFANELQAALLDGEIDAAVHSLKDLPAEQPGGLVVACIPRRDIPLDCLVSRGGQTLSRLPPGSVVATSSPRRQAQLAVLRPDIRTADARGNVDTRIARVREGRWDAAILALAGLRRLGLEAEAAEIFGPEAVTPAPGQGSIAVQCRPAAGPLLQILRAAADRDAETAAFAELALARALGADCRTPVGAYADVRGDSLTLTGCRVSPAEGRLVRRSITGDVQDAEGVAARLAEALLREG